ncbi:uncharacterized protein LOC121899198 [Thunnus maccoyii]|uniref:uncharacterized protein LOC121899198 n=1 Tax=Thunnus maccoyii TaxID=8240 RepID=UPI001C4DB993|nr:uncharacterized protein LOC121899198 [Thunnus maccoyii]XP_042270797.1 uncharacterized protein LOC121899198 [Thunnus maccoyii]
MDPADMLKEVKDVLYAMERFSAYRCETSKIKQRNAAFSQILCTCSSKLWLLELLPNLKDPLQPHLQSAAFPVVLLPASPVPAELQHSPSLLNCNIPLSLLSCNSLLFLLSCSDLLSLLSCYSPLFLSCNNLLYLSCSSLLWLCFNSLLWPLQLTCQTLSHWPHLPATSTDLLPGLQQSAISADLLPDLQQLAISTDLLQHRPPLLMYPAFVADLQSSPVRLVAPSPGQE